MNLTPTRRKVVSRTAYCRACDIEMPPGTDMVSWFTYRAKGAYIHICIPCCVDIGYLTREHEQEN